MGLVTSKMTCRICGIDSTVCLRYRGLHPIGTLCDNCSNGVYTANNYDERAWTRKNQVTNVESTPPRKMSEEMDFKLT